MVIIPKKRKPLSEFLKKYYNLIENSNEKEIWKNIILGDYPVYQISNHGRVRRIDNKYIINPFHSYRKDNDGNFIYNRPTYLRVQLYYYENGERKKHHYEISRLVALYFIPIPQHYLDDGYSAKTLEVNHIKGGYEIYNNFVSNLEWCTSKENINKSHETGLTHPKKGPDHHATYINENDVFQICECIEKGFKARETFETIHLSNPNIPFKKFKNCYYNIKYKNSWIYISQYYNF